MSDSAQVEQPKVEQSNDDKKKEIQQQKKEQQQQKKEQQPKKEGKKDVKSTKIDLSKMEKPEYIDHRIKIWDEYYKKMQEELAAAPEKKITISLPDGKQIEGIAGKTTPFDIAMGISKGLAESSVVAKVNGELKDMTFPLDADCTLALFKFDSDEGKNVFWHSSAHILGQALERLYGVKLCTGPALEDGFFYDSRFNNDNTLSQDDFPAIQQAVDSIVAQKQPFQKMMVPKEVALEMFKYNPYKSQILRDKVPDGVKCGVYRCGDLIDPCRGPHLPNTNRVKAFAVTKNSSAYWQGKAENDLLQRVYGISFPDKKALKEWEEIQRLAAERDHRLIGKNQELFFFHPLSPGSAFFLPHGARIYNKLIEFIRSEYRARGFTEVMSPNIYNIKLWETSGHWQNYQENMFSFPIDKEPFALKPMNCPGHCLMFGHRIRSYRELPLRFADFGVLHRNEASGALTGLTRVRRFQQDDAHIFCRADQITVEITNALKFMQFVYGIFGFDFSLELSTRPEKYLGDLALWDQAEKQLAEVLDAYKAESGKAWKLNPGDGAFYGPKIDIKIQDALKRSIQCATIQLDFQLPIRFELEYVEENSTKRPVMIHRAILGSVERMFAILIEHTGGKWPFWLSPRQAIVVPVGEKFIPYAESVRDRISASGIYIDVETSDKSLQKKIRESQLAQYNYILVVGEEESKDDSVNVRTRDNQVHGKKSVTEIINEFQQLTKDFK